MILTLFGVLVLIALVLIVIGLVRPTESAQALVGFVLLFLLSLIIINGTLEYESGSIINTTYTYTGDQATQSDQIVTYSYSFFNDDTSHKVGYYLAVGSFVGFIGVLWALRRSI